MRRLIITLDDDLDKVLSKYPNQSEIVRNALRLYHYDITTDTIAGLRKAFKEISEHLATIERAVSRIAERAEVSIETNSEWGA